MLAVGRSGILTQVEGFGSSTSKLSVEYWPDIISAPFFPFWAFFFFL